MAIQKIPNTLIADNAITATKIANGTLTADDIAANSITAAKLSASTSPTFGGLTVDGNATLSDSTNSTLQLKGLATAGSSGDSIGRIDWYGSAPAGNGAGIKAAIETSATSTTLRDFDLLFKTSQNVGSGEPTNSLKVAANGDISFYDNTGTSQALYWDASAESLGIGLTSPSAKLHVNGEAYFNAGTRHYTYDDQANYWSLYTNTDDSFRFNYNGSGADEIVIDTSGRLLAGTTSTTPAFGTGTGIALVPTGESMLSANSVTTLFLNRTTTDGTIVDFRKDGSTVGSIGASVGDLTIYSTASGHSGFRFTSGGIAPVDNTGSLVADSVDIGQSSWKFRDLYLSGGAYLGGTGAANKLDDYEEGTFSPTLSNAYNITSLTLSEAGRYTKVGSLVHFEFQVTGSFTNSSVESRFSFTVPFNLATSASRATGMFSHHLTSFSNGRFNNAQIFQGTTVDSATWVYISTNQLSGTGSFTGRGTFTYVAA